MDRRGLLLYKTPVLYQDYNSISKFVKHKLVGPLA
jgi:hypothetical protein